MTAALTAAELAELDALHQAAQDGPWKVYQPHPLAKGWIVNEKGDAELGNWLVCGEVRHVEDRAFIVAARNALPALLAEIHEHRQRREADDEHIRRLEDRQS